MLPLMLTVARIFLRMATKRGSPGQQPNLQNLSQNLPHSRDLGFPPIRRPWAHGYGSPWSMSPPSCPLCTAVSAPSGGGFETADECVLQALRDEVRDVKAAAPRTAEEVAPPEPFVLRDKPGCMDVILQRDYGRERIHVACELLLHPQDEGEQHDLPASPYAMLINLTVTIKKEPDALEISCQCHGDEYFINYVSYHDSSAKMGDDYAVHERRIPEDLKRDLLYFLFLRGFDDELAWFLHHHFEKKKLEEHILNLEKVAGFITKHVQGPP